jgi:hypothetical protein
VPDDFLNEIHKWSLECEYWLYQMCVSFSFDLFMIYATKLSVARTILRQMAQWLANNELKNIWKELIKGEFEDVSGICLEEPRKTAKTSAEAKGTIFWDVTPWSVVEYNRRFGATYCLHLQSRRLNRTSLFLGLLTLILKMEAICYS